MKNEFDHPWDLDYWKSNDWKTVQERLYVIGGNTSFNPGDSLWQSLRDNSIDSVRVVVVGQDPYPDSRYCTGHAFAIPRRIPRNGFPNSLRVIFKELTSDLGVLPPAHGDLTEWVRQGVLLWNAIPTCRVGESRSQDWREYHALTREILRRTADAGRVHVFVGAVARGYVEVVGRDDPNNPVIEISHPAHRFRTKSGNPFSGSRLFSRINEKLVGLAMEPIDWRINGDPEEPVSHHQQGDTLLSKGRLLINETGADLGSLRDSFGKVIPRS